MSFANKDPKKLIESMQKTMEVGNENQKSVATKLSVQESIMFDLGIKQGRREVLEAAENMKVIPTNLDNEIYYAGRNEGFSDLLSKFSDNKE